MKNALSLALLLALTAGFYWKITISGQWTFLEAPDLAYVMVRVGESFIWREFITGDEPDLGRAAEAVRVLLS